MSISMANMYDTANSPSSAPAEPDDISACLHQILLRSSSSSSRASPSFVFQNGNNEMRSSLIPDCVLAGNQRSFVQSSITSAPDLIFKPESSSGMYLPGNAMNVSSSSIGTLDNIDADEYDCDSEEGVEAFVDETQTKPTQPRTSSKRSRAAEVHNLSEKRRRSRINEKMKALQNLIPNSNKTDKASMLDEAIEYLKQLQLQVQMLTMRNGLSLYPMCLPGVLQQTQISQTRTGFFEGERSLNMSMACETSLNQDNPSNALFNLSEMCADTKQISVANMSKITNKETHFGVDSSIQAQLEPFQPHGPLKGIFREEMFLGNACRTGVNSYEYYVGGKATSSPPLGTGASVKDNTLEACILRRVPSGVHQTIVELTPVLPPPQDE